MASALILFYFNLISISNWLWILIPIFPALKYKGFLMSDWVSCLMGGQANSSNQILEALSPVRGILAFMEFDYLSAPFQ